MSGTLTGAGTDRKALKIAHYAADKGYGKPFGPQEAAKGLRIIDHRAEMVVARAKPPVGPKLC